MAANVQINASGTTVTVTITAALNSGYNPGTASVELVNNTSGLVLNDPTHNIPAINVIPAQPATPTTPATPASATFTFNNVPPGGYTVIITCGGQTSTSDVTVVEASVAVVQPVMIRAKKKSARGAAARRSRRGY
jgi:hypothetical protein